MTSPRLAVLWRRAAILIGVALLLPVIGATPAWANSELERSDPPNGGRVEEGRSAMTLWFTDGIIADASRFELRTEDGASVEASVSLDQGDGGAVVRITTQPLARATYVLDWKVLSLQDGHPSTGSVVFGVGERPVAVARAGSGLPGGPGPILRWLDLSAIMLAIGALVVSGRVLGSSSRTAGVTRRRARLIAAGAACGAVVSGAATAFLNTRGNGGSLGSWVDGTWLTLTDTPWGNVWLARELALVVVAVSLSSWATRRTTSTAPPKVAVVALTAVVLLEPWAGHASALPSRSAAAALASAAHLAAAGVWAGGLAVLVLCLAPVLRRDPDTRALTIGAVWRAFSPVAATAALVLVSTGLYESGRHLPDLRSVTSTVYGGAVAGKVALMAVALTVAGINILLVNPRLMARVRWIVGRTSELSADPLRRSAVVHPTGRPAGWAAVSPRRFTNLVVVELVVLMAATGVAALLTSVPTAREIGTAAAASTPYSSNVGGLFVTFEEVPAGSGRSRVVVRARSTIKPEPGPITGVDVLLGGPTGTTNLILEAVEPGRYEALTTAPRPGARDAIVTVRRAGQPDAATQVEWSVAPPPDGRVRPLEVVMTTLAALLLIATAAGLALRRRRRGLPDTAEPLVTEKVGSRR